MTNLTHTLRLACFALSAFFVLGLGAQTNQWAWMGGDTLTYLERDAGRQPFPGARFNAMTWTDTSGGMWLYGGTYFLNEGGGLMGDLWKFEPESNSWEWVHGSNSFDPEPFHIGLGVMDPVNTPGALKDAAAWVDQENNLWLFGGAVSNNNTNNALWRYNILANQWTCVSGGASSYGVYGTMGVAATSNMPGSRYGSAYWEDLQGNLWLFGGHGRATSGVLGPLNDLWKYSPTSGLWTWVKGDSTIGGIGVYGILGYPSYTNKPGARSLGLGVCDNSGIFWLFGGVGFGSTQQDGVLNDLWKYNHSTNQWTWMKGADTVGQQPIFGTQGTASSANSPGGIEQFNLRIDSANRIWVFGGGTNQLWMYSIQNNTWTWMKGDVGPGYPAEYGSFRQHSSSSTPAGRRKSQLWSNMGSDLWLFGGEWHCEDAWHYDIQTNMWAWLGGEIDAVYPALPHHVRTDNDDYAPGGIEGASSVVDPLGRLWMFGGDGFSGRISGLLNDLWMFDPDNDEWMKIKGSSMANMVGHYGVLGTSSNLNMPGSREECSMWLDSLGKIWIYGGRGFTQQHDNAGYLNDLWCFNPATNEWTWMAGSQNTSQSPVYGTQGVPNSSNTPGGRSSCVAWKDSSGNFWLFGGQGPGGLRNDLWRYNPATNQWTWKGGSSTTNNNGSASLPSARAGALAAVDSIGQVYLFGGLKWGSSPGRLNDLWRLNASSTSWQLLKGSTTVNQDGHYGTMGVSAVANVPPGRYRSMGGIDQSGALWVYAGNIQTSVSSSSISDSLKSDLWKYTPGNNRWTWIGGDSSVNSATVNGSDGQFNSSAQPGMRQNSSSWIDPQGQFWLYGGADIQGQRSDLWCYSPQLNQWSRKSGSVWSNEFASFDQEFPTWPGTIYDGMTWTDSAGKFWLFGGNVWNTLESQPFMDMMRYDPDEHQWEWVRGPYPTYASGHAEYKGVEGTANNPGSRSNAATWTDMEGNFWMFGGYGMGYELVEQFDLWRFNPSNRQWTWMKGELESYGIHNAVYGSQGVADSLNTPGQRQGASSWTDTSGNLWLFGGEDYHSFYTGTYNDLWRYDVGTNNWTWMQGNDTFDNALGFYGQQGVADSANMPGARTDAATWTDESGNFWMFGGGGYGSTGPGSLNDLWKFSPATGLWTWMKGSDTTNSPGIYGTQGVPANANTPRARSDANTWVDTLGNLWLFGGSKGFLESLNDLWVYRPATNQWTWIKGSNQIGQNATYGTMGWSASENTPGSTHQAMDWADHNGSLWLFGGVQIHNYDYLLSSKMWKFFPDSCGLTVSVDSLANVTCSGTENGYLSVDVQGGDGNYIFYWSSSIEAETWANVGAGSYSVTVSDGNACTASVSATISEPSNPIVYTTSQTNSICGSAAGTATANATGGNGTISYLWSNDSTTNAIFNLIPGEYFLSISDTAGCLLIDTITIEDSSGVSITPIVNNTSCLGINDGIISLILTGTTGSIQYEWSNGYTGSSANGLSAGSYSVTITDANNCTASSSALVAQPTAVEMTVSNMVYVSCLGGSNGQVSVTATGGQGGTYTYVWNTGYFGATYSGLTADVYSVAAVDSNSCYDTLTVIVSQPSSPVSVSISNLTNVLCTGMSTGSATASASGGTGSKTYLWSNGSTSAGLSNLSAGTYNVTATDANGCTATTSVTLSQPSMAVNLSISSQSNVLCFGEDNGTATATGTGGTGSIGFAWSTGSTSAAISTLTAGMYTVTATDQNYCTATLSTTITEPDILTLTSTVTHPVCDNDSNGSITTTTTGGTTPYAFEWSNTGTSSSVSGLAEGSYSVTINDNNGCEASDSVTLVALSHLVAIIDSSSNVLCNGDITGMISVFALDGVEPYTYQWANGGSSALVNANAGTHTVTVTDNLGCLDTASGSVSEPDSLTGTTLATTVTCYGDSNGSVSSTALGGTAPYSYLWDDSLQQTTALAINLSPGQYSVTVTDANGCTTVSIDSVAQGNPIPVPNLGTDTTNTSGLSIVLDPGSFAAYIWPDSSSDSTFVATITGTYWVQVYDQDGCMGTDTINVTIWPTGISETGMGNIIVFPNPTQGEIQIRSDTPIDKNTRIELLNLHGQLVHTEVLSRDTSSHRLHLYGLSQGTYLLRIANGSHVRVFNVVVL